MIAQVEDGKVISVGGDETQPFTRGFLCTKTNHYLERLYSPDRILHPLRRVGAKGSGQFEQISFDEAIATIADRFNNIVEEFGARLFCPLVMAAIWASLLLPPWTVDFFIILVPVT